jgi:hypothetical protein
MGLTSTEAFLALPGPVVSGHPERHVRRVTIGSTVAYLKCEHRVPPRDRLRHALAGYGWVSKSLRERRALADLEAAGLPAPPWLAAGEDAHGRAFLLVGEAAGEDLRRHLADLRSAPTGERRLFARSLGEALARLHAAGFDQPDLSAKHVLVSPGPRFTLLDWQNGGRRARVGWRRRLRALALLDATVAEELASPQERLRVLRAYLSIRARSVSDGGSKVPSLTLRARTRLHDIAPEIHSRSERLLDRRTVREARRFPLPEVTQHLHWLDGESLCAVPSVAGELDRPSWRAAVYAAPGVERLRLEDGRAATLTRRCHHGWRITRRGRRADELRQAGLLFHLQRHGVPAVRLLAFGQRGRRSFLMTEAPPDAVPLAEARITRPVARAAAALLRALHAARCHGTAGFGRALGQSILVHGETGAVALVGRVDQLRLARKPLTPRQVRRDRLALLRLIRAGRGARA